MTARAFLTLDFGRDATVAMVAGIVATPPPATPWGGML